MCIINYKSKNVVIILYELFQQNEYILSPVKFDKQEIEHVRQITFVCE